MVISVKRLWIAFLTLIVLYAFKSLYFRVPLYRIVFPAMTVIILFSNQLRTVKRGVIRKSGRITFVCWLIIILWGVLLTVMQDSFSTGKDYLWWDVCLVCVAFCFMFYFSDEALAKTCLGVFFAFSAAIGLSGIYESLTGRLYHETHVTYRVQKNAFGLVRPNTIFFNINDSAVFLSMGLIAAFLFAEYCKKNGLLIRLSALLIFGANVLLTESRGAMVGIALFLYVYYMKTLTPSKKFVYVLAAIPVVVSFIPFIQEMFSAEDLNLVALGGRANVWRNSISTLVSSGFLGNGPGNTTLFNYAFGDLAAVHNWFLEIICDYGFVGGIALLIWYFQLLIISNKLNKTSRKMIIVFAGLLGFSFLSVSSSSLIGKGWPICFIGVLAAEINQCEQNALRRLG